MLSDDLLTCPPERLRGIRAVLTVVGGEIVHDLTSRPLTAP
jgi:predicted amidohydrolase YtcJ